MAYTGSTYSGAEYAGSGGGSGGSGSLVLSSSWVGDDDARWQLPLLWSCVIDLDPPDDVED